MKSEFRSWRTCEHFTYFTRILERVDYCDRQISEKEEEPVVPIATFRLFQELLTGQTRRTLHLFDTLLVRNYLSQRSKEVQDFMIQSRSN